MQLGLEGCAKAMEEEGVEYRMEFCEAISIFINFQNHSYANT